MNSGWGIIIPYKLQVASCLLQVVEKNSNLLISKIFTKNQALVITHNLPGNSLFNAD
jgi:hypothetical protein